MLHLRISSHQAPAELLSAELHALEGVLRLANVTAADGRVLVSADVRPRSAEIVLETLDRHDIAAEDFVLSHMDVVAPIKGAAAGAEPAWIEVIGEASANARPVWRFLVLMAMAGVIAAVGVIDANQILIIGAMAVSPDLLPMCALCVGITERHGGLVRRAGGTLAVGLLVAITFASALTLVLRATGALPGDFVVSDVALGTLSTVDVFTVIIAFAAGIAGVLAFETRASAAVGVAISITTIPAAAYCGAQLGDADHSLALGSLGLLATNVGTVIVAGTLALLIQRAARRRSA